MNILIVASGKHGSTIDIARAIAEELSDRDHLVFVSEPDDVLSVLSFDAVILGSAVYMQSWQRNMREFVRGHAEALRTLPVWLFSVGMSGEDPKDLGMIERQTGSKRHHLFRGRLDYDELTFMERSVAMVVRAKPGDTRDWDDVGHWAESIDESLSHAMRQQLTV